MLTKGVWILLALLPPAIAGSVPSEHHLVVYSNLSALPQTVSAAMRGEFGAYAEQANIRVAWGDLQQSELQAAELLVIVEFRGRCNTDDLGDHEVANFGHLPLGWALVQNGEILPFVKVICDLVRPLILEDLQKSVPEANVVFGTALGRILAHEILCHILANKKTHSHGLAKQNYTREDLAGQRQKLGAELIAAIARHLNPHLVAGATGN